MYSKIFIVLIGLFFFPHLVSAKVAGISGSQKFVDSSGAPGVRAVVRCLTSNVPRTIVRLDGNSEWCDSEVGTVCRGNKLNAAKQVCSSSYRKALEEHLAGKKPAEPATKAKAPAEVVKAAEVKPAKVKASKVVAAKNVDTSAAQTELFDIEQKRVQIKQRQLELRKLELELEKQRASALESGF